MIYKVLYTGWRIESGTYIIHALRRPTWR